MGIENWLYKGAPAGTQQAVQNQVRNMGWGQIAKNIVDEGGYGFGKKNVGFDPNYTGKGALPTNTVFQKYVSNPLKYTFTSPGNIGGGTMASRQAWEKMMSSPLTKALGTTARLGSGAGIGVGIGQLIDTYLKKTDTPQAYAYRKQLVEEDPYYFDETNLDVGEGLAEINRLNRIYTPGDSFRSMNDPSVYGTTEDNLIKQPNFMGENYPMQLENVNPSLIDRGKEALGTGRDAIQNAINLGLGAISGIPFVGSAIDFIGDQFEYKPAGIYADESGGIYNQEVLDRMNAKGGWYTEPARASRRRDKAIDWMEKRKAAGDKRFSEARLAEYKKQQAAERRERTKRAMQAAQQEYGSGSYDSGAQAHEAKVSRDSGERMGRI